MTIVGKQLGKSALGAYSVGFNLASIPVERIAGLLSRATPAILSAVQTDVHALRRYFLGITEGLAMVTMPVAVGLALVASEFVGVALGRKWDPAVSPLTLLALAAVFRSLFPLLSSVLVATGGARRNFLATVAIATILPPLFLLGSEWGISGVAVVWLLAYPLVVAAFFMRFALSASATTVSQYLRAIWPAASAALVMSAMVLMLSYLLPHDLPPAARLVAKVATGALTYSAVLYWSYRDRVMVFVRLFRSTLHA
jgi:O-antigen/teichoic acid export membrane protein